MFHKLSGRAVKMPNQQPERNNRVRKQRRLPSHVEWERIPPVFEDERGWVLFPTVILVILIFTIGFAALELTAMEARISLNQLEAAKALYLAEAGVQLALHRLERDPWWKAGIKNYPFGEGIIKEVKVEHKPNSVTVESQGEVNGTGRRVRVELAKKQVPFAYPLVTNNLVLGPGAKVVIEGDALHYGDFFFPGPGELRGFLLVDGPVTLGQATIEGTIYATGSITVNEGADLQGKLVSAGQIRCQGSPPAEGVIYANLPVNLPRLPTAPDFAWYLQQPHFPLEEPVLLVEDLWSGFFVAPEDLTLWFDHGSGLYWGQAAIIVPGTAAITCDLVPADPTAHALFIIADRIVVEGQVREIHAALLATESIQFLGGASLRKIRGTLLAPTVLLPPGTTELQYCTLPGVHLVPEPQTLFQITDWLEVVHW